MKAGFLFADRTAARQVLTQAERRDEHDKQSRRILITMAAAATRLLGR